MASLQDWFDDIGGWLRAFVDLLFSLAVALLVVYVLFGQGVDVIGAVTAFVGSFTADVTGLIVLLIILAIYRR